jgi:hypothetical protein
MKTKSKNEIITQKLWVLANNFYHHSPTGYVDGYEMPLPYAKKLVEGMIKDLSELLKEIEGE